MKNHREEAIAILLAGIEGVKPEPLIRRFVSLSDHLLQVGTMSFPLSPSTHIYLTGAGKASALMAGAMENIFGKRISEGHVITKYHHAVPLRYVSVTEAGHPVPDEKGLEGTKKILALAQKAGPGDIFFCLLSGGGSALLTDVPEGCSLQDIKETSDLLIKSGATIHQINCVRKHLSCVKGGQLARMAYPATVISLILSDVTGDDLSVIASGPTAPDPSTYADAMNIIAAYELKEKIPQSVYCYLREGMAGQHQETVKEEDLVFEKTHNLLIGNNRMALEAARQKAEELGYETQIVTHSLEGDCEDVARHLAEMAKSTRAVKGQEKICLLLGGETTVRVKGNGLGGRNQHLALLFASLLEQQEGITFLSAGTDGTDGPTDAAGAVCDLFTLQHAKNLNLSIRDYIERCDAYHFFRQEGGLVITGPTGTNVMDMLILLID